MPLRSQLQDWLTWSFFFLLFYELMIIKVWGIINIGCIINIMLHFVNHVHVILFSSIYHQICWAWHCIYAGSCWWVGFKSFSGMHCFLVFSTNYALEYVCHEPTILKAKLLGEDTWMIFYYIFLIRLEVLTMHEPTYFVLQFNFSFRITG